MATNKKLSETGWFYHAPAKNIRSEKPIPVPPASQIPGLSDLQNQPYDEPKRIWIKETDSPYIQMAKMGGRPDLLRIKSPKPRSDDGPKPYPRVDWFYQDDIAMENEEPQQNSDYQFLLPDYMVHNENKGGSKKTKNNEPYEPKRLPYGFDKTTIYDREGEGSTDKTQAIPEARPAGYGIRAEKQHGKPVKSKYPMAVERGKAPVSQLDEGKPQIKLMALPNEEDHPAMGKILAYGYGRDWELERDKWEEKQTKSPDKKERMASEYQSSMAAGTPPVRSAKQRLSASSSKSQKKSASSKKEVEQKELFKLSKFKSVPAKTDTNRQVNLNCNNNNNNNNNNNMSSSHAPFANDDISCSDAPQSSGRRIFESSKEPSEAPFATDYAQTRQDLEGTTPSKRAGRRRFGDKDCGHEAPFATADCKEHNMFGEAPKKTEAYVATTDTQSGRQKPIKPNDNSAVFRYDPDDDDTTPTKGGRKRYDQQSQRSEAPYAVSGGDDTRFQNTSHKCHSSTADANNIAGLRKDGRREPPPNSSGEGMKNQSAMKDAPFALH